MKFSIYLYQSRGTMSYMLFPCPWVGQLHVDQGCISQFSSENGPLLSLTGNNFLSTNVSYTFSSAVNRSISIACVSLECTESQQNCQKSALALMMWLTFHLPLGVLLSVGAVFTICSKPNMMIASLAIWDRKSKDLAHPLRANGKFVIPNLSHHAHKLFLIWVWLNCYKERFMTNLLPQTLSGFLLEVIEFYTGSWFPIGHISCCCAGWNRKNPLEYMEVQILESLSARTRQQPEDMDYLRCSPTKNITLRSNIALCSMLELVCCI